MTGTEANPLNDSAVARGDSEYKNDCVHESALMKAAPQPPGHEKNHELRNRHQQRHDQRGERQ